MIEAEDLGDVLTLMQFHGAKGRGFYVRLKGQSDFSFGETATLALEAARRVKFGEPPRRRVLLNEEPQPRGHRSLFD